MACGRSSQTLQAYNASIGWEADGKVDARLRRTRVAAAPSGRHFWSARRHTGEVSSTRRGNQIKARANRDLRLRLVDQRRRGGAARRLVPLRPHRVDMKRHQLRGRRRRGGGWGRALASFAAAARRDNLHRSRRRRQRGEGGGVHYQKWARLGRRGQWRGRSCRTAPLCPHLLHALPAAYTPQVAMQQLLKMKTVAASACGVLLRALSTAKATRVHGARLRLTSLSLITLRWVSFPLLILMERGMSERRRLDLDDELAPRHRVRDDARRGLGHWPRPDFRGRRPQIFF